MLVWRARQDDVALSGRPARWACVVPALALRDSNLAWLIVAGSNPASSRHEKAPGLEGFGMLVWRARQDSNLRPSASEADTLSS